MLGEAVNRWSDDVKRGSEVRGKPDSPCWVDSCHVWSHAADGQDCDYVLAGGTDGWTDISWLYFLLYLLKWASEGTEARSNSCDSRPHPSLSLWCQCVCLGCGGMPEGAKSAPHKHETNKYYCTSTHSKGITGKHSSWHKRALTQKVTRTDMQIHQCLN